MQCTSKYDYHYSWLVGLCLHPWPLNMTTTAALSNCAVVWLFDQTVSSSTRQDKKWMNKIQKLLLKVIVMLKWNQQKFTYKRVDRSRHKESRVPLLNVCTNIWLVCTLSFGSLDSVVFWAIHMLVYDLVLILHVLDRNKKKIMAHTIMRSPDQPGPQCFLIKATPWLYQCDFPWQLQWGVCPHTVGGAKQLVYNVTECFLCNDNHRSDCLEMVIWLFEQAFWDITTSWW